jgi:hypothetical protein
MFILNENSAELIAFILFAISTMLLVMFFAIKYFEHKN